MDTTKMLRTHELFASYQGEGILAGSKTFFIRFQDCNLHCPWCDSKGTWKAGLVKFRTADQIIEAIKNANYIGNDELP